MTDILNNLIIDFNGNDDVKSNFENFGLAFDQIGNNEARSNPLYKINQNELNIQFLMIYSFINEIQSLKSFKLEKINNMYYLYINNE